ncbi:MAG TPA: VOC family protein [Sphingomonas sp.]|uniref:VOC family protein n=1 Tax=Sphingomonas sp. TaxID=28214 RepID=UPI002BE40516|nr:VOC family protein [Sphingomonas sp.]HMI17986.1 VOC family protein [Sphingomonas sp.]
MLSKFHHVAFRCRDAAETVDFYTRILGLKYSHAVTADMVPSTKEYDPHIHIFFELEDGSSLAFFEIPTRPDAMEDENTPAWVEHVAFQVDTEAELEAYRQRLIAAKIDYIGPVGHHDEGQKSIYFFDPNGVRLEFNLPANVDPADRARHAVEVLDQWIDRKKRADFAPRPELV